MKTRSDRIGTGTSKNDQENLQGKKDKQEGDEFEGDSYEGKRQR